MLYTVEIKPEARRRIYRTMVSVLLDDGIGRYLGIGLRDERRSMMEELGAWRFFAGVAGD